MCTLKLIVHIQISSTNDLALSTDTSDPTIPDIFSAIDGSPLGEYEGTYFSLGHNVMLNM